MSRSLRNRTTLPRRCEIWQRAPGKFDGEPFVLQASEHTQGRARSPILIVRGELDLTSASRVRAASYIALSPEPGPSLRGYGRGGRPPSHRYIPSVPFRCRFGIPHIQFIMYGVFFFRAIHKESGKGTALLPLPPLRTGLDGFHHPAQAVCKPCVSRAGKTHRTTVVDACWLI